MNSVSACFPHDTEPDFEAGDIPMLMCGVCAAIDTGKAGWDWRRHLELILRGDADPA